MIVTRILQAALLPDLTAICRTMGFIRADIWRRYGALGTTGKTAADIRRDITQGEYYAGLPVDGTIRAETTKDVVNDLLTYKEAAKLKVRRSIAARTDDAVERKHLFTLLRQDEWLLDPFLHRQMREHFHHGRSHTDNHFVVRSDKHTPEVVSGRLVVTLHIAKKFGQDIALVTSSNGDDVDLSGRNLRVIVKDRTVELHYACEIPAGRPCCTREIGVDKGFTETMTDSDGAAHGMTFGAVLSEYSDRVSSTGRARNKLHALKKAHRAAGRIAKANRIQTHNLGRKKLHARKERTQNRLRTLAYQSTHAVVDKAAVLVSEYLSSPIAKKPPWKRFNRKMSAWAKGVLAEALDRVCTQRGARHELVNGAYTSHSYSGLLEGKREGGMFYRVNGDVLQADHNAARNVLTRLADTGITGFMPYTRVREILLARSPAQPSVNRLELDGLPSPYKSYGRAQVCARK